MTTPAGPVGLVVNPTSGRGRGARAGRRTRELLGAAGHEVVELSGSTLLEAVHRARQGVSDGLRALVVVGGDGMVHLGFNAVATTRTPLGIVAVGSGNDYARAADLPLHRVDAAIRVILDALAAGRTRLVDAAHVAPPRSLDGRWFAGVLSAGLDAAVNARANRLTFPRGHLKYLRAVIGELGAFLPFGYRVRAEHLDGSSTEWLSAGTLVAVANSPMFGGGLRVAPDARLDDGELDLVTAGPLRRLQAVGLFPRLYRGTHVSHPAVSITRATSVTVEPADLGRTPPVAMADGEEIGPLPLRVEIHRGAVTLLA
ncbi:diacylglycerol/lipid kinase family protein [Sanguibacter massiliensis]|uniref:diacylglycerol/lipid kinase family protein n=1 Tax=Sanguibacter massiliensis TaxID=1973217 RepID=UPI000C856AC7|nr:diacylglycerol kinase family protein [Sanguibacter massiliensis]